MSKLRPSDHTNPQNAPLYKKSGRVHKKRIDDGTTERLEKLTEPGTVRIQKSATSIEPTAQEAQQDKEPETKLEPETVHIPHSAIPVEPVVQNPKTPPRAPEEPKTHEPAPSREPLTFNDFIAPYTKQVDLLKKYGVPRKKLEKHYAHNPQNVEWILSHDFILTTAIHAKIFKASAVFSLTPAQRDFVTLARQNHLTLRPCLGLSAKAVKQHLKKTPDALLRPMRCLPTLEALVNARVVTVDEVMALYASDPSSPIITLIEYLHQHHAIVMAFTREKIPLEYFWKPKGMADLQWIIKHSAELLHYQITADDSKSFCKAFLELELQRAAKSTPDNNIPYTKEEIDTVIHTFFKKGDGRLSDTQIAELSQKQRQWIGRMFCDWNKDIDPTPFAGMVKEALGAFHGFAYMNKSRRNARPLQEAYKYKYALNALYKLQYITHRLDVLPWEQWERIRRIAEITKTADPSNVEQLWHNEATVTWLKKYASRVFGNDSHIKQLIYLYRTYSGTFPEETIPKIVDNAVVLAKLHIKKILHPDAIRSLSSEQWARIGRLTKIPYADDHLAYLWNNENVVTWLTTHFSHVFKGGASIVNTLISYQQADTALLNVDDPYAYLQSKHDYSIPKPDNSPEATPSQAQSVALHKAGEPNVTETAQTDPIPQPKPANGTWAKMISSQNAPSVPEPEANKPDGQANRVLQKRNSAAQSATAPLPGDW